MTLEQQTKTYIKNYIKDFYSQALEHGAILSEIEDTGANTYKCTLGNMTMLFIGTADGTARIVACEGDIFEDLDENIEVNDGPILCTICDDIAKYRLFDEEYCAKCLVDVIEEDGNDEFVIDRL